jgi:hypothetical protein
MKEEWPEKRFHKGTEVKIQLYRVYTASTLPCLLAPFLDRLHRLICRY